MSNVCRGLELSRDFKSSKFCLIRIENDSDFTASSRSLGEMIPSLSLSTLEKINPRTRASWGFNTWATLLMAFSILRCAKNFWKACRRAEFKRNSLAEILLAWMPEKGRGGGIPGSTWCLATQGSSRASAAVGRSKVSRWNQVAHQI